MRVRVAVVCVLIGTLSLCACGLGSSERTWHEQVRLSDGRIVEVERRERYRSSTEWGGPGDLQRLSTELRMTLAPGQKLPLLKIGDGKSSEVPLIMDVADTSGKKFFAVAILDHEDQIKAAGLDITKPYYEYLLIDGAWKRQSLSDELIGRKTNLLLSLSLLKTTDTISLEAKEAADKGSGIPREYRCVRRTNEVGYCK